MLTKTPVGFRVTVTLNGLGRRRQHLFAVRLPDLHQDSSATPVNVIYVLPTRLMPVRGLATASSYRLGNTGVPP